MSGDDRVAVITDIHGNVPALYAALARIDELGVTDIYCGGDLVGYGPHPNEVCALIQERAIPTIYGNYDYAIARDLEDCGCAYITPHDRELGQQSVDWTLAHTNQQSKDFMRELPFDLRFRVGDHVVHLVHGSPRKVNEYLFEDKPARLYERLARDESANALVFGHTHKPWVHDFGGVRFINCGSVGKPKDGDPRGAFAVLEPGTDAMHVTIERVAYDADTVAAEVREAGLPADSPTSYSSPPDVTALAEEQIEPLAVAAPTDVRPDLARRMLMEAIGTFALVVAGCGAVITDATRDGALGSVGISLVFGLIIMAMIYAGGHLSGAHYNPAVTIAFTIGRHFPVREAASYIAAQLAGALAAALLLLAAWPDQPANLGATLPSVAVGTALVYEIVLTAILMFVITAVATDTRAIGAAAAIAIGGTVALDALFGGPITGASMNPARSIGPALASGTWTHLWLYIVGPAIGAAVGVLAYTVVRGERRPLDGSGPADA